MLFLLAGYSGSGKNTVQKELNKYGIKPLITCTTRPMRTGEVNGKEYAFLSNETFENIKKCFFETTSYNASFGYVQYGTLKAELDSAIRSKDKHCLIVNPDGARAIRKVYDVPLIILDCSIDSLTERLLKRGDTAEEIRRRLETDNKDFKGLDGTWIDANRPVEDVTETIKRLI